MARRHGAVLIRTGDSAIWIGQLRSRADGSPWSVKLPATTALSGRLDGIAEAGADAGRVELQIGDSPFASTKMPPQL